jgi:hypothetical protein
VSTRVWSWFSAGGWWVYLAGLHLAGLHLVGLHLVGLVQLMT